MTKEPAECGTLTFNILLVLWTNSVTVTLNSKISNWALNMLLLYLLKYLSTFHWWWLMALCLVPASISSSSSTDRHFIYLLLFLTHAEANVRHEQWVENLFVVRLSLVSILIHVGKQVHCNPPTTFTDNHSQNRNKSCDDDDDREASFLFQQLTKCSGSSILLHSVTRLFLHSFIHQHQQLRPLSVCMA